MVPEIRAEFNTGLNYVPSTNIAPQSVTPVIVAGSHFEDESEKQLIVPMLWGMIPFWHKGDHKKHGLSTNNCRLEHLKESKLYKGPFSRGQRCVVLCEGFYEWQTTKSAKPSERPAYYIYMPQDEGLQIHIKSTWQFNVEKDAENKKPKVKLLKLAGLFDVWVDEKGDKIYSYSIITFESSQIMSWLHSRMPAVLETDEEVAKWIDYKTYSNNEALEVLKPAGKLSWHKVSKLVNNSRQKSKDCNKPFRESSKGKITSFLAIRKRKEDQIKRDLPLSEDEIDEEEFECTPKRRRESEDL